MKAFVTSENIKNGVLALQSLQDRNTVLEAAGPVAGEPDLLVFVNHISDFDGVPGPEFGGVCCQQSALDLLNAAGQ